MALAVNDILQFTDVQSLLGQVVLNVYFYKLISLESGVNYQTLADNWETLVRTPVRAVQHTSLSHTSLIIKNLTNEVDIHEEVDVAAGLDNDGNVLASFYAIGFRLIRATALTRHGSKRIAGVTETKTDGNTFNFGGTTKATLEAALGNHVVVTGTLDNDFDMAPVIVGRIHEGEEGAGGYDLSKINLITAAQYIRVTTQTTRRAGRGN